MPDQTKTPHIAIVPGTAGGQAHIAGRRIKVRDILFQHEHLGRQADEIASELDLGLAQVYAALAYYLDHQSEIESDIADRDAFIAAMRQRTVSLLSTKVAAAANG
ncbi:MAG: DUF433 domain-containing protein [Lamprobacter sp.]|uniref:DUF433 domain-containing protein n=1 Tax=Lamprobacter sp. TaxID=3100796 RepID=UPI002B257DCE|nr:DUF433 domain-containing protein [Lamprobacter sp.]MEA3640970.1 DUF433 domain-containing protein [Lamprobacter sp.]